MAASAFALNIAAFARVPFVDAKTGTLTREAQQALQIVQRRVGGEAGLIYADTITTVPAGGLTSADVQAALDELDFEKQTKDATLTALAALATAADRLIYATGSDTFALATFTAFARSLLDDLDAASMRTTLGLGSAATANSTAFQAADAELAAIAALVSAADRLPYFTGLGAAALATFTAAGRALVDDADATAQRATLGLGSIATQSSSNVNVTGGTVGLASGSLGYATGNGGAVTQLIDKSTGVLLNKISGEVTMNGAALAAGAAVSFSLSNSTVDATDVLVLNHASGGTAGAYALNAQASAGSVNVTVRNLTAGPLSEAIVLRFAVIKAATA